MSVLPLQVFVAAGLAKVLKEHQWEGLRFLWESIYVNFKVRYMMLHSLPGLWPMSARCSPLLNRLLRSTDICSGRPSTFDNIRWLAC